MLQYPWHVATETFRTGQSVVEIGVIDLKTHLNMVQPGLLLCADAHLVHTHARGRQIAVTTRPARLADNDLKILAQQRLSPGQPS